MSNTIEKIILRFLWIEKKGKKVFIAFLGRQKFLSNLRNHKKMKEIVFQTHGNNKEETAIEKGF